MPGVRVVSMNRLLCRIFCGICRGTRLYRGDVTSRVRSNLTVTNRSARRDVDSRRMTWNCYRVVCLVALRTPRHANAMTRTRNRQALDIRQWRVRKSSYPQRLRSEQVALENGRDRLGHSDEQMRAARRNLVAVAHGDDPLRGWDPRTRPRLLPPRIAVPVLVSPSLFKMPQSLAAFACPHCRRRDFSCRASMLRSAMRSATWPMC